MIRVYVAGPYSANNVISVLDNMRAGMRISTEVFLAGFAPFCPWLDYQYSLMLRDGERLTVEQYYAYSLAWLEVSDAVLVTGEWEQSAGTRAEIEMATSLGIPVFHSLESLLRWRDCREKAA